jgi:penicillin amidase
MRLKILRLLAVAVPLVALAIGVAGWLVLRGSLPALDGSLRLDGLAGPASISRDETGVVTIRASRERDLAFAVGYAHAQDRFFQMDLTRRRAAGELSALFGEIALEADRSLRLHRFRARANALLADADPADLGYLESYASGVNAALAGTDWPGFEYLLLGVDPAPWVPADSLLIIYSMFIELNDELGERDALMGLMDDTLPPTLVAFLTPTGTAWDAPMTGGPVTAPPLPSAADVDLREGGPIELAGMPPARDEALVGSNNWAVGGAAAPGGAMVANDMHLPLRVPNVFYRQRVELAGPDGYTATGVALPGTPMLTAGSNGEIAWGFTNSYGDWTDLVLLETDPENPNVYRTPLGDREFDIHRETIAVKGGAAVDLELRSTVWGPVIGEDHQGRLRAVKWTAHQLDSMLITRNMIDRAPDLRSAMAIANAVGSPPQNIVIADRQGNVAWTIMGRIPGPVDYDRSRPADWRLAGNGWQGWLPAAAYPRIVNPASHRIWTANARAVDGDMLAVLGDGGYALGARASQIRDGLFARESLDIGDMREIQLDDRALFFERWRDLLLRELQPYEREEHPGRADYARIVAAWSGRASTPDAGFRLVYEFRLRLHQALYGALTAPMMEAVRDEGLDEDNRYGAGRQFEGAVWALLEARPPHLLNPLFASWHEQIVAVVDQIVSDYGGASGLAERTWGEANTAAIRHPLSGSIPVLGRWLDMPAVPLDGAVHMPRVQRASFGSSERFAVSPGREQSGFFHMPGGQSGHPLSPFYRAGHDAWVNGDPTPFLPGPERHRLDLLPSP